jgi:hypothetical protein
VTASLPVVDPDNTARFIQIRGDVELVTNDAVRHVDTLIQKYTMLPRLLRPGSSLGSKDE